MSTFEALDLAAPLMRALSDENYKIPTAIQSQTIPPAVQGKDILGCAQTGTGKTAAFALPILNGIGRQPKKAVPNSPFVLILAPTRELAIQISDSMATYGKHLHFRQTLVYGGVSQLRQVRALNRGVHLVIATPGRLIDLMNQGHIHLDQLHTFVLDEADRMLDMGFLPDIRKIISKLPKQRQSLFFSATLPPKAMELAQSLLRNPVSVNVTPETPSVEKITQQVMFVERKQKMQLLLSILAAENVDLTLVFTRTKRGANALSERLGRAGIKATAIHGDKSQNARQRALQDLRLRKVKVLVATDVAARGIDVDGISHVVNYDIPEEGESYVHRIGRTGRAGNNGVAISFCTRGQKGELGAIEAYIGQEIPLGPGQTSPFTEETSNRAKKRRTPREERRTAGKKKSQSRTRRSKQPAKSGPRTLYKGESKSESTSEFKGKSKRKGKPDSKHDGGESSGKRHGSSNRKSRFDKVSLDAEAKPKKKRRRKPRKGKNERMREKLAKASAGH